MDKAEEHLVGVSCTYYCTWVELDQAGFVGIDSSADWYTHSVRQTGLELGLGLGLGPELVVPEPVLELELELALAPLAPLELAAC